MEHSIVAATTKCPISRFYLPKDDLLPLFCMVISENGKTIWHLIVTATIRIPSYHMMDHRHIDVLAQTKYYDITT